MAERLKKRSQENEQHKQDLTQFLAEADAVSEMSRTRGFEIIKRDILNDRRRISSIWPRVAPGTKQFDELRIHALSNERILMMVLDYKSNRKKALETLLKMEGRSKEILADIDTETPLEEEGESEEYY